MPRKIKLCLEKDCKNAQTAKGYCRLHYIKNWKTIKRKEKLKEEKRLNRYVDGVMKKSHEDDEPGPGRSSYDDYDYESSSNEVENLIEDLGYSDPDSLDEIISNLKIDR